MNQTSSSTSTAAASSSPDFVSLLTSVHLIWIALIALLVIAGIVYGSRLKHRRTQAERELVEHAEQAGVEPKPQPAEPAPRAAAPIPEAVAVPSAPVVPPSTLDQSPPPDETGTDPAAGPITQLKGLGPKVAARLAELGVTTVGQVAALDHDAAARLDNQLGAFKGRMERDRWIEQARFLAAGDVKGFEAVFGRL